MGFRKFGGGITACTVLMAVAGCDCNKTSAQINARKVMVATVLSTSEINIRRDAIAGFEFDASIPFFDGGIPAFDGGICPFDGGCNFDAGNLLPFLFDGGSITIPQQTGLFVFFGTRQGSDLASPPVPVDGAMLAAARGDHTWMLKSQGSGIHTLTSQDDATLNYESGATWTITASAEAQMFVGDVTDVPSQENIRQLHPEQGYIDLTAGSDYVLTRPDPDPGFERNLGFVSVFEISQGTFNQAAPTYTNVPTDVVGFLKLVAAPSEFRETVVTIPGTAFPERDTNYVILYQSAKVGFARSENLFIGSAMIAGIADVGVVKTRR